MSKRFKIGKIVPGSKVTLEKEVLAAPRKRGAIRPERSTFHSSRTRMHKVTAKELSVRDDIPMPVPFKAVEGYVLERQVGFLLRRAHQRASGVFAEHFGNLSISPVQLAALAKIADKQPVSQNQLGRFIHMDPATTMEMINRLCERSLVARRPDRVDRRRLLLSVQPAGRVILDMAYGLGRAVNAATLAPLEPDEQAVFLRLLAKLV